jgi:hypothetical protein
MISARAAAVLIAPRWVIVRRMAGEITHPRKLCPRKLCPRKWSRRRAAVFVWLTGCVEIGLFGSCAVGLNRTEQLTGPMLAYMVGLGLVPGLVYLAMGFGVQAGRTAAIYVAMLIALTQALVLVAVLVNSAVGAFAQGNPQAFTLAVVLPGSLLGLIVATIWRLWQALNPPG